MNSLTNEEIRYQQALKRVKRIKGFYSHLLIYVVINIMIIIVNAVNSGEGLWRWENYVTAMFWGIGLAGHAFSVFVPNVMLSKDWETRKINELMEKEKQNKWE